MKAVDVDEITRLLKAESNSESRDWWTNYVKGASPFLGTPTSAIRLTVKRFIKSKDVSVQALESATQLAFALLERPYSEEKIAGMLIIKEYVIPFSEVIPQMLEVQNLASLFDRGFIKDWNICDWFCVRVSGQLIRAHGDAIGIPILHWCGASNLWRARASVVSFIAVIEQESYHQHIIDAARVVNQRKERFAKTGVAWVLREMSKYDPDIVARFVDDDLEHFSKESLRNSTKYFGSLEQKALMNRLHKLQRK